MIVHPKTVVLLAILFILLAIYAGILLLTANQVGFYGVIND